jgi:hypothetical protein
VVERWGCWGGVGRAVYRTATSYQLSAMSFAVLAGADLLTR